MLLLCEKNEQKGSAGLLKNKEFEVLRYICESSGEQTQRLIAEGTGLSLGITNAIINGLIEKGFIDTAYGITPAGVRQMEPYKVDNAIILAAGMSTRFVPFSYERPKGLTVVKGEVLIERQIRQLKEAGVPEIILVLGFMLEKFLYLVEKYDVSIVINNDYSFKNTHSSLYYARENMKNSYICCADNYFPKSVFHRYEYRSIYSVIYMEGTWHGERGVTTGKDGLIISTQRPAVDQWVMNGYSYFNKEFSTGFSKILEDMWNKPGSDNLYWEQVYAEHVKELPLYAVKYTNQQLLEFDSVAELEMFDPDFIKFNDLEMTRNICRVLKCSVADIHNIRPVKKGFTNKSFSFECGDKKYIYRHPGTVSSLWLDRKFEKKALEIVKERGIDDSYVYENEESGWKLSNFVETTETFSFANERHISMLCKSLHKLYDVPVYSGRNRDYLSEAKQLLALIRDIDEETYNIVINPLPEIEKINNQIQNDNWKKQMVHNDLYEDNLLISNDKLYVIDWEYVGDTDIGYDLCKLFVKNDALGDGIDHWLSFYYGRKPELNEKKHIVGCAAVSFYYWYVWAAYMIKKGNNFAELMLKYLSVFTNYRNEFNSL